MSIDLESTPRHLVLKVETSVCLRKKCSLLLLPLLPYDYLNYGAFLIFTPIFQQCIRRQYVLLFVLTPKYFSFRFHWIHNKSQLSEFKSSELDPIRSDLWLMSFIIIEGEFHDIKEEMKRLHFVKDSKELEGRGMQRGSLPGIWSG